MLATLGRWYSTYELIVGTFFFLIFLVGSIYLIVHNKNLQKTSATIKKADCTKNISNNNRSRKMYI